MKLMIVRSNLSLGALIGALLLMPSELLGKELIIDSVPRGATVWLEGEYSIVGRTPFQTSRRLMGNYRVKANRSGYEVWSARMDFKGTEGDSVLISLSPCTPLKAGLRSVVFPGWGQIYSGRRARGIILNTVFLGGAISTVVAEVNYQRKVDDYEEAIDRYNEARTIGQLKTYEQALWDTKEEADDAYTLRQTFLWTTAAFWLYNVFDAVLSFPSDSGRWLTFEPLSSGGTVSVSINF